MAPDAILKVQDVRVSFGGIVALDQVSFEVPRGGIAGLIGPNGAGKTTLFNCLSRIYTPNAGSILFDGSELLNQPPHRTATLGIGRTFQNVALFNDLSVRDNIKVGAHSRFPSNILSDTFRIGRAQQNERRIGGLTDEMLDYMGLTGVQDIIVSDLPFGTRKRVEMARALAAEPKLLLLDEPACGLNHEEVEQLGGLIRRVRDERGISILLVEHHMHLVMSLCDSIVALNFGRRIAAGTPEEVRVDPAVVAAYLGASKAS
ncbi:ABC transporter ATP-binding protein [Variovorax ureilyticus]|uniref:ABC transporter ATP-binding protein n=1 Tax=Variovorax ureilyticus TaxID=1836198 RepID=A0ABU8VNZ4_9BURK